MAENSYDLLVIGGGINGTAIARDAAGRGLRVILCEKDDLASHTSSASTKLIHGGLRYLEHYDFALVRKSLLEREVMLKNAPHIIWPLRFVLPYDKGLRPAWLLRLGLFLYDHIGGRKVLPPTRTVDLKRGAHEGVLQDRLQKGYEYSDCWVDDARLVTLNAVDAFDKGADIFTRARVSQLKATPEGYEASVTHHDGTKTIKVKGVVNAAGPWVEEVLGKISSTDSNPASDAGLRLVKGSHIVTNRLYAGDHAYFFQSPDNRMVFAIPYETDFTLIGTTDIPFEKEAGEKVEISEAEISYLCSAASQYFKTPVRPEDVVWSYSGVRPLYDDKEENASAVTRDYVLKLEEFAAGKPFISVYGGKITTSRKLAEHVLTTLSRFYPAMGDKWTSRAPYPGGDMKDADYETFYSKLTRDYPWISQNTLKHLARVYGTRVNALVAGWPKSLGQIFGPTLSEAEVKYLVLNEWAKTPEDILWRRTKLGLHMSAAERKRFAAWYTSEYGPAPTTDQTLDSEPQSPEPTLRAIPTEHLKSQVLAIRESS